LLFQQDSFLIQHAVNVTNDPGKLVRIVRDQGFSTDHQPVFLIDYHKQLASAKYQPGGNCQKTSWLEGRSASPGNHGVAAIGRRDREIILAAGKGCLVSHCAEKGER
jgi:hypothetical protein